VSRNPLRNSTLVDTLGALVKLIGERLTLVKNMFIWALTSPWISGF